MRTLFILVLAVSAALDIHSQCNEVQVLNSAQNAQLASFYSSIQTALYARNLNVVDSLSNEARIVFGSEGGQPETQDTYSQLNSNTTWLPVPTALVASRALIAADSIAYTQTWRICKGELPPAYQPHSVPLRAGAEISIGLIRIAFAETDIARRSLYLQWATDGLDSLLTMQLPNGAFPFPDLRTYNDPVYTPIINNYLQSIGSDSVNVLINGWIIDDSGTGEFKFDAGVIGGAFAEAFLFTGDTNYRNAALSVAAYMDTLRMNTNYNYNTFQSYGLAFGFALAPSRVDWIMNADTILRYSVLPGQLSGGRWMDGHNARSVYHGIIIHNVSVALLYAPSNNQWQDTLSQMLCAALRNFLSYENNCDASTGFDGLLRAWRLNTTVIPQTLHDSLTDIIGQYINNAVSTGGDYLDVYTMGLYLDLATNLMNIPNPGAPVAMTCYVFPNPSNTLVTLQYASEDVGTAYIEVVNSLGQQMDAFSNEQNVKGINFITYDPSKLPDGMYFFIVKTCSEVRTIRWYTN